MADSFHHISVLLHELIDALALTPGDVAVDATAGGGGHTTKLLSSVSSNGRVFAMDQDPHAVENLGRKFAAEISTENLCVVPRNFRDIERCPELFALKEKISGICFDLGVSSPQLDDAHRGFSFSKDGPLDMRMDQNSHEQNAADIVNQSSYQELFSILRDFGEEPKAKFIAQAIVTHRDKKPITRTSELAELVKASVHYKTASRHHPAMRTFMALRIAVNDELGAVERGIKGAFSLLKPGGRLAVITFHSLEDRIVKKQMAQWSGRNQKKNILHSLPLRDSELPQAQATIIKPFPTVPSNKEITENPRARSAKLRVVQKV